MAAAAPRPNFIFILADDLGWGDLGCYGSQTIRTPHLDALAREGMRFTDFYAASPFCSPSRAALLTGRYPWRAGVPNVLFPTETRGLPASEITLAKALKAAGYATACIGKWHLGQQPEQRAHRQGFDEFYGLPYANDMAKQRDGEPFRAQHAHEELPLLENDRVLEAPVDQHGLTQRYTARAIDFIRRHQKKPFFLFLSHTFPHTPLYASKAFEGRSPHGLYADTVEELDASTGAVIAELRRVGLHQRTMVVFTSDNGPVLGGGARANDPRWQSKGSAGPFRAGKGSTYEGGMRVPGIIWQPGTVPAGRVESGVASALDLLPTALDLARVKPPAVALDGRSLRPLFDGKSLPEIPFCYYFGRQLQAIRLGRWKLVLPVAKLPEKPESLWYELQPELVARHYRLKASPELYAVDADPGERQNVAGAHPEIVEKLMTAARRFAVSA